jgi:hypothetical protein
MLISQKVFRLIPSGFLHNNYQCAVCMIRF